MVQKNSKSEIDPTFGAQKRRTQPPESHGYLRPDTTSRALQENSAGDQRAARHMTSSCARVQQVLVRGFASAPCSLWPPMKSILCLSRCLQSGSRGLGEGRTACPEVTRHAFVIHREHCLFPFVRPTSVNQCFRCSPCGIPRFRASFSRASFGHPAR